MATDQNVFQTFSSEGDKWEMPMATEWTQSETNPNVWHKTLCGNESLTVQHGYDDWTRIDTANAVNIPLTNLCTLLLNNLTFKTHEDFPNTGIFRPFGFRLYATQLLPRKTYEGEFDAACKKSGADDGVMCVTAIQLQAGTGATTAQVTLAFGPTADAITAVEENTTFAA
ncbi:hypothetical protein Q5752_005448 [Cryptotrichosporon argae]